MDSSNLKQRLAGMKGEWKKNKDAAASAFGGNTVPAGTYLFKISRSSVGETSKKSLAWFLNSTVIEGDHKGESVFNMLNLEHEIGQQVTAQFIGAMGYEIPDDIGDVVDIAEDMAKNAPEYKGQLKYNKDGYASIRPLEVISNGNGETAVETDDATPEDADADNPDNGEKPDADEPNADDIMEKVRLDLVQFGAANGIEEITKESTLDECKDAIAQYELKEEELTKDEVLLLQKAGLEDAIVKKAAKKTGKK